MNREFTNHEVAYYGVQIASKIQEMTPPSIAFVSSKALPHSEITAMYLPDLKQILFNEDWLLIANWLEVIKTAFHETRHAYQHFCILTISRESEATISIWKQEFEHYFQPNNGEQSSNHTNYLEQRIEEDAISFSNELFAKFSL